GSKAALETLILLVSLSIPKFAQSPPQGFANFGIGTLETWCAMRSQPAPRRHAALICASSERVPQFSALVAHPRRELARRSSPTGARSRATLRSLSRDCLGMKRDCLRMRLEWSKHSAITAISVKLPCVDLIKPMLSTHDHAGCPSHPALVP